MPETNRSIGGEGLEQGGPSLGNDISRKDLSVKNAGDALTNRPTMSRKSEDGKNPGDVDELNLDDDSLMADDELDDDDADDVVDDDDTSLLPDEDGEEQDEDNNV
jgi:hypothetical protein